MRSLSEYERSSVETSERTRVSSSAARASARSTPSPIEVSSRRIAWERFATCSPAIVSGSARRTATCEIARADCLSSRSRRDSAAKANMKMIGPSAASRKSGVSGRISISMGRLPAEGQSETEA